MKVKKKAKLIFTRVFLVSIFLSIFKIKHILEIHNETSGITKFFFNYYYFFNNKKFIKIIYIHKNLKKYFSVLNKCNSLVLDDAVDHRDFKKKTKKIESSCVYTGSLSPGKGLEVIYELAKKLKNTKFFVYGDKRLINNYTKNFPKNIFFKNSVKYNKIPSILKSHKILLMPYLEISKGRSKKINLSKYMSPLKLFDYLAAGRIIFASDLKVYDHVLKNKYNCIKFSLINLNSCANNIKKVLNNYNKYKLIRKNAMKTSYKFSWINRTKKILYLNEKY